MGQLTFVTGTVASGKTLELVLAAYQLRASSGEERVRVLKPAIDTRFSQAMVCSAAGPSVPVTDLISPIDSLLVLELAGVDYILVDEIQFFTVVQVEQLRTISIERNIEVVCYGLLKDFRCVLFDASKRLLELCDSVRASGAYCMWCKRRGEEGGPRAATVSMKISQSGSGTKAVVEGSSICIGGIETFIPVCYGCYHAETRAMNEVL